MQQQRTRNMPSNFRAELTLPNKTAALRLVQPYLHELMELASLTDEEAQPIIRAAHEACANVIDHAFEPYEEGTFTLAGEISTSELTISIQDTGTPFDPAQPASVSAGHDRPARVSAHGGLHLIQDAVDKAYWINKGTEGKELRLVKSLTHQDITEHLKEEHLDPLPGDAPLAPEQEYRIVRFEPEHAVSISRCIYRVYGYTYMHEACYYPDKITKMNESGELVSVVALDTHGDVVGHYALERPRPMPVAERGIAVVSPAHRGRGIMEKMRVLLEEEAKRVGLSGVYSQAVTTHTRSQRVNEGFGSKVCGITLAGGPSTIKFKKLHTSEHPQRVTWVLYHTYVVQPTLAIVHAPPQHRDIIERIYANLEAPVEFRDPQSLEGYGHLSISYNAVIKSGTIFVDQIGVDTPSEIRRAREDLCDIAGAEVVYVYLPVAQPETPALCDAAEKAGFYFSGIAPGSVPEGDALVMQYVHVPLDMSQIQVANPFGQELLKYVAADRERVQATVVTA
jgi:anti-sigma regulatory factor (Ser/Thr protein kinase)